MTAKMEEWIVAFVFAELLALALIIVASCWCCRRSTRRAREEEAHALPMTQVGRPQATASRGQVGAPATTVTGSTTTAGLDSHSGSDANSDDDDDRESHEDDGASLVSGGLWSFVAGGATLNKPRRNSKKNKRGSRSSDVEVVNISVNAAEDEEKKDDEDKMEPGAAALDKRGSAA